MNEDKKPVSDAPDKTLKRMHLSYEAELLRVAREEFCLGAAFYVAGKHALPFVLAYFGVADPRVSWWIAGGGLALFLILVFLRQRALESDPNRRWP